MKLSNSLFSKYEKNYVRDVIKNGKRLDSRSQDEYRKLDIHFGKEWGVCIVSLGETKVMAQVTCSVQQPKTTRPNEGMLFLNVEISPMAAPNVEQSVVSEFHIHLTTLLEKCIKESHCVDLESLCIVAEEKVWNVRVDIVVLNYDGNIVGCSSIAAVAALSHFRRPDVTVDGEKFIIHTHAEKDPLPLSMRHYPVLISYAIFENGHRILSDPSDIEERTSEAELVLGMNAYRELCGIYLSGAVLQELNVLLQCAKKAATTAATVVQKIKTAIEGDESRRKDKSMSCIVENIDVGRQLPASQSRSFILTKSVMSSDSTSKEEFVNETDEEIIEVKPCGVNSAEIVKSKKKKNKKSKKKKNVENKTWLVDDSDDDIVEITDIGNMESTSEGGVATKTNRLDYRSAETDPSSDDDIALVGEITSEDRIIERIELSGDSEEEEVLTMLPSDISPEEKKRKKTNIKNENN